MGIVRLFFFCIAACGIIYQASEDYQNALLEEISDIDNLKPLTHYRDRALRRCTFTVLSGLLYTLIAKYLPGLVSFFPLIILITVLGMISSEIGKIQHRSETLTYLSLATAVSELNLLCILFVIQLFVVFSICKYLGEYSKKYLIQCILFLIAAFANIIVSSLGLSVWINFYILLFQSCILPMLIGLGTELFSKLGLIR